MTYQEMIELQRGCPAFVMYGTIPSCNSTPHYVQPVSDDQMAHSKSESPDNSFNGLSIADVQGVQKYKNMDALHKADAVARDLSKSERLGAELKEIGADAFASRRLSK